MTAADDRCGGRRLLRVAPTRTRPMRTNRRRTDAAVVGKYVLWVVAIVVVVIIVAIIRHLAPGSTTPGSLDARDGEVGYPLRSHKSQPGRSQPFTGCRQPARRRQRHHRACARRQQRAIGGPVKLEVTPYVTALTEFGYTTHGITWPQAMQVPAQDLFVRTESFISFLNSISFEGCQLAEHVVRPAARVGQ